MGLEQTPRVCETTRGSVLSVLYIARVGLEQVFGHAKVFDRAAFSPLHSEGGIGTGTIPQTPFRDATLSVLYIARVGLELAGLSSYPVLSPAAFSPLHSEGGIGTLLSRLCLTVLSASFSPLHSEGGIGTGGTADTGVAVDPFQSST